MGLVPSPWSACSPERQEGIDDVQEGIDAPLRSSFTQD
jgi:hypothetical protein